jgi:hypothetical protein
VGDECMPIFRVTVLAHEREDLAVLRFAAVVDFADEDDGVGVAAVGDDSPIHVARTCGDRKRHFVVRHLRARGYFVLMVGRDGIYPVVITAPPPKNVLSTRA